MKGSHLIHFVLAFSLALGLSATVAADDTEIFFNTSQTEIRPNLLFVLDNSGSMDEVVETTSEYDPSTDYEGSRSDDYIYFRTWNCDWRGNCSLSNSFYSINKTKLQCADVLTALENADDHLISYRMAVYEEDSPPGWWPPSWPWNGDSGWEDMPNQNVNDIVDCQADDDVQDIDNWTNYDPVDVYSANYVNWYKDHRITTYQTRMEIVQEVANALADSMNGVNIGLMTFKPDDRNQGGRIQVPVQNIADNRATFKSFVDGLWPATNTPLAETLFGAMRYYSGGAPFLDDDPRDNTIDAYGNYESPITHACQSNNVIFLTDGEPTNDADGGGHQDRQSREDIEDVVGNCNGNCMDEIADYMRNNDMSSTIIGEQNVTTYTVGFQTNQTLLADTARRGGGDYYQADDAASLQTVFENIVRSVVAVNTTFVAPGVAVNSFNRLNHLDSLYFSVFQPQLSPRWHGNLKRYRLGSDGKIYDENDAEAVNANTGFFKDSAQSWWSPQADGPVVAVGGAASQLPTNNATRPVYTWYPGSISQDLTNAVNAVSVANKANIGKTLFGDANMSDADHEELINWTRGLDVHDEDNDGNRNEARKFIADPLHSVPHLVIYGPGNNNSDPDTTVFFGDNQGFIHAINGATGAAYFSFIPAELLDNQKVLLENPNAVQQRVYGMDGSVVSWQHDANRDKTINAADGDKVYIFAGMRRGGRGYYALDVTDRANPELVWRIAGGSGDYTELGQTWSKPVKTKIMNQGNVKEVLIFSGGYDTRQDDATVRTPDTVGRALYIVDATNGNRLWWAGPEDSGADLELNEMLYSIPASPKAIDISGDGLVDQIYVGDMGGQILRFDLSNGTSADAALSVTGGVIADLAGDTAASNRRFYHSPDLFGMEFGGAQMLGLVIGSGWQAHPLNETIDDRIYMLRIADVNGPPMTGEGDEAQVNYASVKVTETDLYDTTANLIQQGTADEKAAAQTALADAGGWYIRLTNDGEKVLSSSQTVGGETFLTTYEPVPPQNSNTCTPGTGTPRLYHIYAQDGSAVKNYNGTGTIDNLTEGDRYMTLATPGLPPDPQRMRIDGDDVVCVGAECYPIDSLSGIVETYWTEE